MTKTIYHEKGRTFVSDSLLAKVMKATEEIHRLWFMEEWEPCIEIEVEEPFRIKVQYDSCSDLSIHSAIGRALSNDGPRYSVTADLGHYSFDGWESLVEYHDIRELPTVYFTHTFMDWTIGPLTRSLQPDLSKVRHWRKFMRATLDEISDRLDSDRMDERDPRYYKLLQHVANSLYNGDITREGFIDYLERLKTSYVEKKPMGVILPEASVYF